MSCQYLSCYTPFNKSWSVASCSLNGMPYVPSVQELENYCKAGRHQQCPLFFQSLSPLYDEGLWPEFKAGELAQCR